ncbi:outer membrane lipid asymmetry maintenance protein MlaD [Zophobihabitans entericus]|uniref:Outer membrane lipid asymmetry maintenance protein MlaD n=1 Tax=Zophobihabitans entericus TaxID=1635327 RepID=A0A6G9IEK3_9GAMM|nr:outer membrane lipid asymmetry maintenance protein MlaD [Zophobihabitans entericus]QIQ22257.1 outer membrane lipid asymmetry maintenance protein MlaD [Zophobihabitans entericus]
MQSKKVEITVGLFMLIVICSVLFLCFKVTDASSISSGSSYRVYAIFDNVGGLKARSPIKIGGVVIGRIDNISLDSETYKPYVSMDIQSQYKTIPSSSALSIKTSGLLGEQFISVDLGIDKSIEDELDMLDAPDAPAAPADNRPAYFSEGFVIHNTKPAMVLEDLIGQFLYKSDTSETGESEKKE